jgi:hypothetical protein
VLFAPGPHDPTAIKALVDAVRPKPINVLVVRDSGLSVADIAALGGVTKLSIQGGQMHFSHCLAFGSLTVLMAVGHLRSRWSELLAIGQRRDLQTAGADEQMNVSRRLRQKHRGLAGRVRSAYDYDFIAVAAA